MLGGAGTGVEAFVVPWYSEGLAKAGGGAQVAEVGSPARMEAGNHDAHEHALRG